MQRFGMNIIGLVIGLALMFGTPVHALIPHTHSHSQSGGESVIWQALHSSLRHEDKKALPFFYLLAIVGLAVCVRRTGHTPHAALYVDTNTELLRRGIVPHRAFG